MEANIALQENLLRFIPFLALNIKYHHQATFTLKNKPQDKRKLGSNITRWGIGGGTGDAEPFVYIKTPAYFWHEPISSTTVEITDTQLILSGRINQAIATVDLT